MSCRSSGNALGNRWDNNSKSCGIGLLKEYDMMTDKGSDQGLSAPDTQAIIYLLMTKVSPFGMTTTMGIVYE
jgi:hypothetical protein